MSTIQAYLDNAATTCVRQEVLDAMLPFFREQYGNPSSRHAAGCLAREAVDAARETIATIINSRPNELIFTSGGTEADHLGLVGTCLLAPSNKRHIIISAIEHQAVLRAAEELEQIGFSVSFIQPDSGGIIRSDDVLDAVRPDTYLASIMLVNNEIGTIQPIDEIGAVLKQRGVLLHCDAVQGFGKIPVDVKRLNVDLLSLSAHKLHGPKGVGALFVRSGVSIKPQLPGGGQEHGVRSGTENVPAIAGFARAAELAMRDIQSAGQRITILRDRFETAVLSQIHGSRLATSTIHRSPYLSTILFPMLSSDYFIAKLDSAGICATSGSACSSHSLESSHVLRAIGLNNGLARNAIRFSLSPFTTDAEINYTVGIIRDVVNNFY